MNGTDLIPVYVRVIAGLFALANIGYGVVGYFNIPSRLKTVLREWT